MMPSLWPSRIYDGPDVVQPEVGRKVPASHAASLVGHGRSCHWATNPPHRVPVPSPPTVPAGQAPGRCQNKHPGMATLTFAFCEQTLGEGGSRVIFCRLVTRQETTCSVRGVWDRTCPRDFAAIPNVSRLTPSPGTSSLAEPAAVSRALAMLPGVSARLNVSCHALLSPCQDQRGPHEMERLAGHGSSRYGPIRWGQAPLGSLPPKKHPCAKAVTALPDAGAGSSPRAWLVAIAGV